MNKLPSQAVLSRTFAYSPTTGEFIWLIQSSSRTKPGQTAGCMSHGYLQTKLDGVQYRVHRIIWKLVTGKDPHPLQIDHADGNPLNNRWENLRVASLGEQARNRRSPADKRSGLPKGVALTRSRQRYLARITKDGRQIYLGTFDTPEEAHQAYLDAINEHHGSFANPH
jgi:hypothetical protein